MALEPLPDSNTTIRVRTTLKVRQAFLRYMADNNYTDYDEALVQLLREKGYLQTRRAY